MKKSIILTYTLCLSLTLSAWAQDKNIQKYQEVLATIEQATQKGIYNPRLLKGDYWKVFLKNLKEDISQGKIKTDKDMIRAFFKHRKNFPFTHYSLYKKSKRSEANRAGKVSKQKFMFLEEKSPQTAYLKVKSFDGTATEVDEVFAKIFAKGYQNLIIDLRGNTGGTVESGLQLASYLFPKEVDGGIFLTRRWYAQNTNPPAAKDYSKYPYFSKANFKLMLKYYQTEAAFNLKLIPNKRIYKGKIYVLTNGGTGSTCEPLVYGLKRYKLATIVGGTTTGGMLSGYGFNIAHNFVLFLPMADYYTPEGTRIDMVGVKPNIEVLGKNALKHVMKMIEKKQ